MALTKIEYRTPPGSGDFSVLAEEGSAAIGNTGDRISGLQFPLRKSPAVEAMFEAPPLVMDLGNGTWNLRFSVDRIHSSESAALEFLRTHGAIFTGLGNCDVMVTRGTTVLLFSQAALTEFVPAPDPDRSTVITYGFVSALLTTVEAG